jgi:hypothetical protein
MSRLTNRWRRCFGMLSRISFDFAQDRLWDAPRFACGVVILQSWKARIGTIPGASPSANALGCFAKLEAVRGSMEIIANGFQ